MAPARNARNTCSEVNDEDRMMTAVSGNSAPNFLRRIHAPQLGKREIHDDDVWPLLPRCGNGLVAVGSAANNAEPRIPLEKNSQSFSNHLMIVNDQYCRHVPSEHQSIRPWSTHCSVRQCTRPLRGR